MTVGAAERIAAAEGRVPNLRPGCEKRILSCRPGGRAPLSVVYVHGFSASAEEIRPVPDRIAAALGAPVFFTRLAGHGQDGAALGRATLADWRADIREAAEVAAELGDRTLWIGCSTGATLIAQAMAEGMPGAGVIFVSPNFGLAAPLADQLLDLPATETWLPRLLPGERGFRPANERHARYWTIRYPLQAILPMAEAVRTVRAAPLDAVRAPALVLWNPRDKVVSGRATRSEMARWGGDVDWNELRPAPGDDPMGHILAGDILSPGGTDAAVAAAVDWAARRL